VTDIAIRYRHAVNLMVKTKSKPEDLKHERIERTGSTSLIALLAAIVSFVHEEENG
jgi:hypothetical protein